MSSYLVDGPWQKSKLFLMLCISILLFCVVWALAEIDLAEVSISGAISWNTSSPEDKKNTLVEASELAKIT
jgi:hypothetical protein